MSAFKAPTGTRDVLAPESARFEAIVGRFAHAAGLAGYGLVVSPMFEDAGVFRSGVGESSDVVTKEMYLFEDRGGRTLALRPEGTASVVRAFVQHHPLVPWKAWYATPAFRYERPQAGRYRQHHQLGVEVIGTDDPDADVEVVALLAGFYGGLGLSQVELRVNSMGDSLCMPGYRESLGAYLAAHESELCDEHRVAWARNPLRVLDCKRPECVAVRAHAPRLSDALCGPCREHFDRVLAGLDALGIAWRRDDALVRGLDYYMRTTFEFAALALDAAQNAIGGGGRYDGLVERLGGPPMPGVGFGSGIERVMLACEAEGVTGLEGSGLDVFVVDVVGGAAARDLTAELRRAGLAADRAFDGRSLKSQLKQADRSGARLACIVGPDEEAGDAVTLRWMREEPEDERRGGHQERVARAQVVEAVRGWLR
ncbi:MAG TPA: histidine--tRNA ligase [Acidimicrobiales bacterium]|nr:histidine--tRNA ligase [Acidimicrobiales bacterium]